jgi:hypothetical protein
MNTEKSKDLFMSCIRVQERMIVLYDIKLADIFKSVASSCIY